MSDINYDENKEGNLLLCNKCYQNDKYIIPLYCINKERDSLEYKCSRNHILNEAELLRIKMDEETKNLLTKCKEHEDNVFCGWCKKCEKNICFLCISEEMKKKHDYMLFMEKLPEIEEELIYENKITKLKSLFKEYNFYCPYLHGEIKLLNKLIDCCETSFNIYYKEKIVNYQTINNIILNFSDLDIFINSLFTKFQEYQYLVFFCHILKENYKNKVNQINKLDQKMKTINKIKEPIKLLTLINDNENNKHKRYFVLLYEVQKKLSIYDDDLILINEIDLKEILKNGIIELIQYDSNTLLLFQPFKFIFIFFSSDYKRYNIITYYSKGYIKNEISFNDFCFLLNSPEKKSKIKIIKTNKNYVCLLNGCLFNINLGQIIFKNEKSSEYNIESVFNNSLTETNEFILDIIPIYYNDNNNSIIKGIISIGIKYKSKSYSFDDNIVNFDFLDKTIFDEIESEYKITIYTNELKVKDSFTFKNIKNLIPKYYIDLKYSYPNNMLFLFVKDNIIQININTREITTIYVIDCPNLSFDFNKNKLEDTINENQLQIFSFHNYNKKLKKMELIILIKEIETNTIYPYLLEDNSLLFTKEFKLPNFIDITEFDLFDNTEKSQINSINENTYKIFVDSDKIILFK